MHFTSNICFLFNSFCTYTHCKKLLPLVLFSTSVWLLNFCIVSYLFLILRHILVSFLIYEANSFLYYNIYVYYVSLNEIFFVQKKLNYHMTCLFFCLICRTVNTPAILNIYERHPLVLKLCLVRCIQRMLTIGNFVPFCH